jgi:uncharacterized membrane protein YbhN (UPF0104 family)
MSRTLRLIFQYGLGIGLGIVLLLLAFRNIDWAELRHALRDADYRWVGLAMVSMLLSHWMRAWRWQMLLEASGHRVSVLHAYWAVLVGYMTNNAVPRAGEISRCTILYKSDRIPLATNLGTVMTERAVDVLALGIILLSLLIMEGDRLLDLLFPAETIANISGGNPWLWLLLLAGIGLLAAWVLWRLHPQLMRFGLYARAFGFGHSLLMAALSVRRLRSPLAFWVTTVLIWVGYVCIIYWVFSALDFTQGLSFRFAYIFTGVVTIGMMVPAPGGIGPFHYFAGACFAAYGLEANQGVTFALLAHTPQVLLNSVVGAFGYFYLIRHQPPPLPDPVLQPSHEPGA